MNEDIRGLEGRLTLLKDFDQVVSHFTKEVSGADAEAAANELLRSSSVPEPGSLQLRNEITYSVCQDYEGWPGTSWGPAAKWCSIH
ncbi:hypothetical protein [Wenjunlia tyrosinilytica]|uniref:Uncharacterized protein n=1 Tax=Wenjunlia tyrosinilytica TaxID=1544741 RepID=A0A918A0J8_9ACTN|nr:hypothetical protein [Wenjunlia tyrosinilytica]GGP00120.1 hypothetical protein GCM10012280_68150 [Wenjunlia tyrosinilytica]